MSGPLLYIARAKKTGCTWLKIGASRDPEGRMKSVHSPDDAGAELVRVIEPDGFWRSIEKSAHVRLLHRPHWREWFDISENEALWAIYSAEKEWRDWRKRVGAKRNREAGPMSLPLLMVRRKIERGDGIVYWKDFTISEENYNVWPMR